MKWAAVVASSVVVVLTGCATNKSELKQDPDHHQKWATSASVEKTFKTYKNHAEESFALTGLMGSRIDTSGHFYGDNAELTVKMVGNPMARVTYLHLLMNEDEDGTEVQGWAYNSPWEDHLLDFKTLLPSE
ncbi:hypothetical protein RSO41_05890 [Halomonas sp. I1]|uniref:hypothetical protein n=1 Tax=Halomonas sp. I1 TaxID=393536 RepID=UPI0028DDAF86|nr:hypothetical protein [Halomonas sp. I1]MDT8894180.1 hypothetical protein [Halomonas sp. I1]